MGFEQEDDEESNPETAAPKGVWGAMHTTQDTNECACRSRSMHMHMRPRARARK